MADVLTTATVLANQVGTYYHKRLIERLVPRYRFYEFADKMPIPANSGKNVYFNGYTNFAGASAALSEGTNNDLQALSARVVSAVLAQYGRGVKVTDFVDLTAVQPVIENAIDNIGDAMAETIDRVCMAGIYTNDLDKNSRSTAATCWLGGKMSALASAFCKKSGTLSATQLRFPVLFGTSATRLSAVLATAPSQSAQMSVRSVRRVVRKLRTNNALPFADGNYVGIAHPEALENLMRDPAWASWNQYSTPQAMYKGEAGKVQGVRFVESTAVPRYRATAHSCDGTFIFGQHAYAVTSIDEGEGKAHLIIKKPNNYDTANPWNLYSTVTFKVMMAAAPINPSAGVILLTHYLK